MPFGDGDDTLLSRLVSSCQPWTGDDACDLRQGLTSSWIHSPWTSLASVPSMPRLRIKAWNELPEWTSTHSTRLVYGSIKNVQAYRVQTYWIMLWINISFPRTFAPYHSCSVPIKRRPLSYTFGKNMPILTYFIMWMDFTFEVLNFTCRF